MFDQLIQLAELIIPNPVNIKKLEAEKRELNKPGDALCLLTDLCSLICENLDLGHDRSDSIQYLLIKDLFCFLAELPEDIKKSIQRLNEFPSAPKYSWQDAGVNAFSSTAELIQDVWEHCFGPEAEFSQRIISTLLKQTFKNVLDFGCGAGFYSFCLAANQTNVTCIENNSVKRAFLEYRKKKRPEGERISLEIRDQLFDGILAINVFDHIKDASLIIKKFPELLRSKGKLCYFAHFTDDGWHQSSPAIKKGV